MSDIFITSDQHFFHKNIMRFKDSAGDLIRPFANINKIDIYSDDEWKKLIHTMNEYMIEKWNSVVKSGDKVYHLGDVSWKYGEEFASIMARLNGQKQLFVGNHDNFKGTNLESFFGKIHTIKPFRGMDFFATHIPTAPYCFPHGMKVCVHGHTHDKNVLTEDGSIDLRYINVCVEKTDYTPLHIDHIKTLVASRLRLLP
jgi:calcineurin-like phosphoesterase family protein